MPLSVRHIFTNAVADGTNTSIVRPSDWNSAHALTLNLSGTDVVGAFSNANNISFGTNPSGFVTASYSNTVPYLTTAMASNRGSDFVAATAAFAGTNASGTIASNGISVSVAGPQAGVGIVASTRTATTAGNILFDTGNGVTFGLNAVGGSVMTASVNTSYRASNDAVGLNTALTAGPLAWTVNSAGISLNASSVAGTTSGFAGTNISGSMTHNSAGLNLALSVAAPGAGGGVAIAGGTQTATSGTVVFSNSNGISFGMSGSSRVTMSHNALTQIGIPGNNLGSDSAFGAIAANNGPGALSIYASRNLSWGNAVISIGSLFGEFQPTLSNLGNTSGDTGTYQGPLVLVGSNNITLSQSTGTFTTGATNITGTRATITISGPDISGKAGTGFTSAGNNIGISGTLNTAGLSLSATVAAQSVQPVAASASNGSFNFSTLKFVEGSGVTWATQANGIQASVKTDYLTTAMQSNAATISNVRVSGGTTSNLLSALTFADGNGISFGLNAGTMTASHNGLTTAMASNRGSDFMGTNTALTANGVSMTANSSGLSLNFPAFLTTAMASNRGSDFVQANAVFAGTNASGTIASNGISVSVNPAAAGVGMEAGTRTATTAGNLRWETGNGITFGLDAVGGSVMTASHNALTTAMASNRGSDFIGTNTALTAGPLAWTANSAGLSLNAGSAAGTTTGFAGANISGSMTHNTAGLNLSLSVAAPGGAVTESLFWRPNDNVTTVGAPINASMSMIYCPIDRALSASRFDLIASANVATAANNSSAGVLYSITAALYTLNGGTLSSVSSITTANQFTWTSNATGSATGAFFLSAPLSVNAPADKYWVGVQLSTRATGLTGAATTSLANTLTMMGVGSAIAGAFSVREPGANTANSNGWFDGMGMYSGTTNFSTIALSNLTQQGTNAQRANLALRMKNM